MTKARSIWFTAPEKISYKENKIYAPSKNEIRIKTLFSGISHGTEMLVYRGQVPEDMELDISISTMEGSYDFPIKYGYSSVGEIIEVGPEVKSFNEGNIVFVHNPHETGYVILEELAVRLSDNIQPKLGIFIPNINAAMNCILDAGINIGETVVIFGQGVIGLLITQLVKLSGAQKIFTVDKYEKRRNLSMKLGADLSLNPYIDNVPEIVKENTDGIGADVVIEASASPDALDTAIKTVAFQSSIIVLSWYGTKKANLSLGNEFHRKRIKIKSSQVSNMSPSLTPRWNTERRMKVSLEYLTRLNLSNLISHVYSFEEAEQAYEMIDKYPEEVVQVMLEYKNE